MEATKHGEDNKAFFVSMTTGAEAGGDAESVARESASYVWTNNNGRNCDVTSAGPGILRLLSDIVLSNGLSATSSGFNWHELDGEFGAAGTW